MGLLTSGPFRDALFAFEGERETERERQRERERERERGLKVYGLGFGAP